MSAQPAPLLKQDWARTDYSVEGCTIWRNSDGWFKVRADMDIDGDGANGHEGRPPCYAPRSYAGATLDDLAMAGHPGNWWGVVTDNGQKDGTPIIQGPGMPAPGAYISQTSYRLLGLDGKRLAVDSPDAYLDSAVVPFMVLPLPAAIAAGAELCLGSEGWVEFNGLWALTMVGDKGPTRKIGEASPACASLLGIRPSARNGGVDELEVTYYWHPGWPATIDGRRYPLQRWAA